ncbi:MAG: alpha/beta hydrolase family protein, partial [Acidobacteriota bacterium]
MEKVYFESYPGFFVTGNLYRPLGRKGPFPGLLSPHGHWSRGRLHSDDAGSIPGRCINLARQGYVVFTYDMVGYNDSSQLKHSFHDELWATSLMGLQLWDSIRAVDFISSLPDVDPNRLGCTGASGGGTQTFMLMAVDDRIKVAAPVCMISAHFQGGCECENAPLLRLETYNVEIATLMAPRPLILISATGDWTKNNPTVEYPDIRSTYRLFGAEDRVKSVQFDAGHNYNKDSREAVYPWFGRWLLPTTDTAKLKEQPFTVEKDHDLLVFTEADPRPSHALNADQLKNYLIESARTQIERLKPTHAAPLKRFRRTMSVALEHTLAASL